MSDDVKTVRKLRDEADFMSRKAESMECGAANLRKRALSYRDLARSMEQRLDERQDDHAAE